MPWLSSAALPQWLPDAVLAGALFILTGAAGIPGVHRFRKWRARVRYLENKK
jgi:hypothetical protein